MFLCFLDFPASSQLAFVDVTADRGLGQYAMPDGMGSGVSAADFDGDGDVDFFLPTAGGQPNRVYRNRGDGFFDEVAASLGLASTMSSRVGLWFDSDGDGDLDLVVAGDHWSSSAPVPVSAETLLLFLQQADGTFDFSAKSGLNDSITLSDQHRGGLAAGDLDGDGDLDLVVALWAGPIQVFRNSGSGVFEDVSCSVGVCAADRSWQPFILDIDSDQQSELYLAIDFSANELWQGDLDAGFIDMAPQLGLDNAWNDMGIACGDVDSDGDLDLYVTNVYDEVAGTHNELFLRQAAGGYARAAVDLGVEDGGWGWGATFADFDLDGDLDLGATNGWRSGPMVDDTTRLFNNLGPGLGFVDVAPDLGIDDTYWGSTLLAVDIDLDGDLDIIQSAFRDPDFQMLRLLENRSEDPTAHWLALVPRSSGANTHGIGSVITVVTDSGTQVRMISAGTSFLGQEPSVAHFGLADEKVHVAVVQWPAGQQTHLIGPGVDRRRVVSSEQIASADFESGSLNGWSSVVGSLEIDF